MRVICTSGSVRGGDGNIPAYSARRLEDGAGASAGGVQLAVAAIGVGLQNARSVKKLERPEAQRPSGVSIAVPEMVQYDFADGP